MHTGHRWPALPGSIKETNLARIEFVDGADQSHAAFTHAGLGFRGFEQFAHGSSHIGFDGGTQQIGRRCVGVQRVQRRDDLFEQDLDAAGLPGAVKPGSDCRLHGAAAFCYRVAEQNALDAMPTGSLRGDSLKVQ